MAKNNREIVGRAIKLNRLLAENQRISIRRIADEMDLSERHARRWVEAFNGCFDLRIERGIVIVSD